MDEKNVLEKRYKVMDKRQVHYDKVKMILTSCENKEHLKTAVKIINQYTKQYQITESDEKYKNLNGILGLMKTKLRVKKMVGIVNEDLSPSGNEFKTQAGLSGSPELQKIKFEQDEIEGGVADDKTPEDLSKKHNVSLKDIVDEIKVGKKVEKEHTVSDELAKEIAMDHIDEFPEYYTDEEHGVLASEKGLEEEDIEESSTAGSSGAFVGALGSQPIKRDIHTTDTPVSDAGGMDTPIGKIRSFKKSQLKEFNVITKRDMLESTDGGSITTYDSPAGWGNSEFMGTKGKKGNAVQRKGNDHKVTYKGDGKNLSKFVKIKDKCKKFPYCNQDSNAIEISNTPFNEGIKDVLPTKEKIKEGWVKFVGAAKREGKETTVAAGILKKVLLRKEVSEDEYSYLKEQSIDIAKIFGLLTMGVISTALPVLLEKLLNKKGISIMPTENKTLEVDTEELIESICKETGKSKNYVHSLINKYL